MKAQQGIRGFMIGEREWDGLACQRAKIQTWKLSEILVGGSADTLPSTHKQFLNNKNF